MPTVQAAQKINAPHVKLGFMLTMEFAKLVLDCALSAAVPLFVQNGDLKNQ